jgi:hypothetical protein
MILPPFSPMILASPSHDIANVSAKLSKGKDLLLKSEANPVTGQLQEEELQKIPSPRALSSGDRP